MRRAKDIGVEGDDPPPVLKEPAPLTRLVIGEDPDAFDEDDEIAQAIKLLEDAQEVLIFLQSDEVQKAVPIPVWNALIRAERRIMNFLLTLMEDAT
jgi:hypothetical protein